MSGPIDFSSEAVEALKSQAAKRQPTPRAVRFGVKGGACSGLQYVIMFEDEELRPGDVMWDLGGVNVVVDKKSILYLSGTSVTWTKTLMKQGFEFHNPNEASRCSCGLSFSAK